MTVIANLKTPGHITEALHHANQSIDSLGANRFVDAARGLSDCLNKLKSEWFYDRHRPDGEMAAFKQLLLDGMGQQQRQRFLYSTELLALAEFTPQILIRSCSKANSVRAKQFQINCRRGRRRIITSYPSLSSNSRGLQIRCLKSES